MTREEIYMEGQRLSGIKVGDKVKILRKFHTYEGTTRANWNPDMESTIGKIGIVRNVGNFYIEVNFKTVGWSYPWFVLEVIEKAPDIPHINFDYDRFGCNANAVEDLVKEIVAYVEGRKND